MSNSKNQLLADMLHKRAEILSNLERVEYLPLEAKRRWNEWLQHLDLTHSSAEKTIDHVQGEVKYARENKSLWLGLGDASRMYSADLDLSIIISALGNLSSMCSRFQHFEVDMDYEDTDLDDYNAYTSSSGERCSRCRGTGMIKCSVCNGRRGRYQSRYDYDTGITYNDDWVACYFCEGIGTYDCPRCGGKGRL